MARTIASVETTVVSIPMRDPLITSLHAYVDLDYLIVRLRLSDGAEGYGEARESLQITGETAAGLRAAIERVLAPAVIGHDAADLEGLHRRMEAAAAFNTAAKSALDMAAVDAVGRSLGVPACVLLGGAPRGEIASSKAISVAETEAMVAQARRVVAAGFGTLKIKTGVNAAKEIAAIRAIREAVGPTVHLKLDANQGWTLPEAVRFLAEVERCDIQMVEQPLPAWDLVGSAELRRRTPIPVMLDEGVKSIHDAIRAIEAGACDYINIKLLKSGGLYPATKLVAVAESAGIACQVGTLDTSIGSAAGVHLVHARPAIRFAEINGPGRLEFDVASGFNLSDGKASVAAGPGLGILPDVERLPFGSA
jgi:L-alanine-DL-glutamate epimerase-like enolase superfamily enzyme